MKKALKIFSALVCVASGIILAVFLLPQSGLKAMTVLTGSMTPAIPQDSLVIIRRTPYSQLKAGDVVTYINPNNTKQTITHRIVEFDSQQSLPSLVTKGDANSQADTKILGGNVVGKVVWHIPLVGGMLSHAKAWPIIILFIFIPATYIIYDEIKVLRRSLKKSTEPNDEPPDDLPDLKLKPTSHKLPSRPKKVSRTNIDGIARRMAVVVIISILSVSCARAELFSEASLTNNSISIKNSLGGGDSCSVPDQSGLIHDTGPGSTNWIEFNNNCNINQNNNTNINLININNQQSFSGNGGTTGDTSSNNQTSSDVTISNH